MQITTSTWLSELNGNETAQSTLRKYTRTVKFLGEWSSSQGITDIRLLTTAHIAQFRASRKIGRNTASKELQILKGFFRWAHESGIIPENPAAKIKSKSVKLTEKVPFTREEVFKILAACDRVGNESYERRRVRAAVLVMRFTGLRVSDVLMLRRDAIKSGILRIQARKNKRAVLHDLNLFPEALWALEILPVPIGAKEHTHFFWNANSAADTIMSDMQRTLHRVYVLSQVPGAHNHRFRHTFASELLSHGASLWLVAQQLGITTQMCEKVYGHMTQDYRRQAREATMRAFHIAPEAALSAPLT